MARPSELPGYRPVDDVSRGYVPDTPHPALAARHVRPLLEVIPTPRQRARLDARERLPRVAAADAPAPPLDHPRAVGLLRHAALPIGHSTERPGEGPMVCRQMRVPHDDRLGGGRALRSSARAPPHHVGTKPKTNMSLTRTST